MLAVEDLTRPFETMSGGWCQPLRPHDPACYPHGQPDGEELDAYRKLLQDAEKRAWSSAGLHVPLQPGCPVLLEAVRRGDLGEILSIDTAMCTEHPSEFRTWLKHFQGGTMTIFGCHLIDLILLLQGKPDRVISYQKQTGLDGVDVPDNGLAILEYPRGVATVRTSSFEVNGYGRRHMTVCGSLGSIEIKPLERPTVMAVTMKDYSQPYADARKIIDVPENGDRYDAMMLDFAQMVRGEKENPYSYAHELLVQQATLMAGGFKLDF
jgi:predicted dehydrogenase